MAISNLELIETLSDGLKKEHIDTRIYLAHEGIGSKIGRVYTFIVNPSKTTRPDSGFKLTIPSGASIAFIGHSNVSKATICGALLGVLNPLLEGFWLLDYLPESLY